MNKPLYYYTSLFAWGVVFFLIIFYAFAWNPPVDNPPNANLPAPINTSSVEQTKAGNLNLDNNLKVGGLLRLGLYTSHPTGTNGNLYYNTSDHKFYGYQNNEWKELGGGAGFWLASGDNIYNTNTGNVGIGTTSPGQKLAVAGNIDVMSNKIVNLANPTAASDAATKGYVDAAGVEEELYSLTANNGMYRNKITNMVLPTDSTEICFKNGATYYDVHSASQSTTGGNCLPGDIGYIIERNERTATYWELAKQICLQNNMRLAEPFEWKLACKNATTWSLNNMTDNWEWASNFALPMYAGSYDGVVAAIFGGRSGCSSATWGWVGYDTGFENSYAFRCVR